MSRVGDLVRCIWQPKIKLETVVYGNKCMKDLDVFIENEIGIIVKEENNSRYLVSFAHLGYKHILSRWAFINISEIEREKNET